MGVVAEARSNAVVTERVVVLMTPEDKRQLEGKARAAGVSVGEVVRRAVESYDPEIDDNELIEALLRAIRDTSAEAITKLEAARREVRGTLEYLAEQRREHGDR